MSGIKFWKGDENLRPDYKKTVLRNIEYLPVFLTFYVIKNTHWLFYEIKYFFFEKVEWGIKKCMKLVWKDGLFDTPFAIFELEYFFITIRLKIQENDQYFENCFFLFYIFIAFSNFMPHIKIRKFCKSMVSTQQLQKCIIILRCGNYREAGEPLTGHIQPHGGLRDVPWRGDDLAVLLGRQERQQEATSLPRTQRRRQVDRPLSHTGTHRVFLCSVFPIHPAGQS